MRRSWTKADIPSGHHFQPSDEELIKFYLLPWSKGLPLPIKDLIVERDVYGETADPRVILANPDDPGWELVRDEDFKKVKRVMYVLTKLTKIKTRFSRRAGRGTWSGQTPPREIYDDDVDSGCGVMIGCMRMFSFEEEGSRALQDHWTMHEYSLALDSVIEEELIKHKDHVLCKITWTREEEPRCGDQVISRDVREENVHKKQKKAIGISRDVREENVHKKQKKKAIGSDYFDANKYSLQPMLPVPDLPAVSSPCAFGYGDYELTQEDLTILNNFIWST
ncbi:NAC domain containing protein 52 [Striga asiatica]|uniref:NAC domain containing protein 52 n=1 Tax=Striga asiatica TaxID=4170 RepID=A0A5A7R8M4_STRAF|nr:NAC domain containing protein 52 [Striga asiatica]